MWLDVHAVEGASDSGSPMTRPVCCVSVTTLHSGARDITLAKKGSAGGAALGHTHRIIHRGGKGQRTGAA